MGKDFNPIRFAADVEQAETVLIESTPLLNAYYCALKETGLPEDLERALVVHWHDIFWQNAMTPRKDSR